MKYILILMSTVSLNAYATCADVSGEYLSREGLPIKYTQADCITISRYMGSLEKDGSIIFPPHPDRTFVMDGKDDCDIRNRCTTVTLHPSKIEFKLNFNAGVNTDDHGQCTQRGYSLSKDRDGNLLADFDVTDCADKFKGTARKTFKKL